MRGARANQHAHAGAVNQEIQSERHGEAHTDDGETVRGIAQPEQLDRPGQHFGRIHVHRRRTPDDPHQFVEEEDEAECRQHLVEMVALIQVRQRHAFDDDAEQHRGGNRERTGQQERPGIAEGGGGEVRPHHVQRAVREIHEVHDPEHQREPGGQQEQQDPELQAV